MENKNYLKSPYNGARLLIPTAVSSQLETSIFSLWTFLFSTTPTNMVTISSAKFSGISNSSI